jgi:ArsR family transcriptional regulator, arsenate/arsenite/antimonite-responsive transcriptional repressor / arsenate reductase (thioredoxin)
MESPQVLRILSNPIRWQLVKTLFTSDRRVQELVEAVGQPNNLVSYHLKLLRESEFVSLRKSDADSRDLYYSLNLEKLQLEYREAALAIHPGWKWNDNARANSHPISRRVLFLCTHNSARSQMAEGLLRHLGGNYFQVASAGSLPQQVHPDSISVMKERGIDISRQRSKHIREVQGEIFDEVITVCDQVREVCPTYDFCDPTIHWSIPNPANIQDPIERRQAFTRTVQELERRIRRFMHTA